MDRFLFLMIFFAIKIKAPQRLFLVFARPKRRIEIFQNFRFSGGFELEDILAGKIFVRVKLFVKHNYFSANFFRSSNLLKLWPLTTFLPVFCSNSKRAFLATCPPFFAGILFSSKPLA